MKEQTNRILSTILLLAVGYFVGVSRWPEPTYAQQAEAAPPAGDAQIVVVAGHASSSSNAKHYYYVVGADGKAKKVTIDGSPLYAPRSEFPTKLQLKHDLPSRIRMDHSGRVTN